jgi:hypothetical protein
MDIDSVFPDPNAKPAATSTDALKAAAGVKVVVNTEADALKHGVALKKRLETGIEAGATDQAKV